ncbi:immunoglobulin superfamily containing leucine-rich repeat protein-like [Dunckerocampus dactyliophorus]|uniref:immunoglobulin superfamily containing leucine-rich repeat protein-like n=1 Tax=Dunckerocampus dactyliophorus TaxID=161453 RepID=UPI0024052096|nr:immunoglobulin superfamily containing leucine-rich repeat protein-like [Dunckerocampus dactyliophorus]
MMKHFTYLMLAMVWMTQAGAEVCPDACKCSKKSGQDKTEVNCHKRGLRSFPSRLPSDAWVLKLGENGITDLQANILGAVPRIESVILEHNAIKSIHRQALSSAKTLTLLNLYGNHIKYLPPRGFKARTTGITQ